MKYLLKSSSWIHELAEPASDQGLHCLFKLQNVLSKFELKIAPNITTLETSAGPKGGPGGHVPPEEAVSALKKANFFHALYIYMILRVYTVMHNCAR